MEFCSAEQLFLDISEGPPSVTSEISLNHPHLLFYSELQHPSLELSQTSLACLQGDHLNQKDQTILLLTLRLQHVHHHLAESWKVQLEHYQLPYYLSSCQFCLQLQELRLHHCHHPPLPLAELRWHL